jgi:hypothetical protein
MIERKKNVLIIDFRILANAVGLDKIAEKIREHNFHALLIIGGYEVNKNIKNILFY